MLHNNRTTIIIALLICLVAGSIFFYKSNRLGLPVTSDQTVDLWNIEVRISFEAPPGPTQVKTVIPMSLPGYRLIGEDFISGSYGLSVESNDLNRYAHWTVRRAQGHQSLYYRIQLIKSPDIELQDTELPLPPQVPDYGDMEKAAAMAILEEARRSSADVATFVREFLKRFNDPNPSENYRFFLRQASSPMERVLLQKHILAGARIPTRIIQGFVPVDGSRSLELTPWLQVHNGTRWLTFNPETSEQGLPPGFLTWQVGGDPVVAAQGANSIRTTFSASRIPENLLALANDQAGQNRSFLVKYSFLNLPLHIQNLYKTVLLIPLGALLVVFMRNVVGVPTFGTFMPVLIALAFKETNLIMGLTLFLIIMALGMTLRSGLDKLRLLLVPRLASVLILVIMSMAAISLISHHAGIPSGLSAAMFPMVILAMTIERMSIVWEESGPFDALGQALGSMAVAVMGFWIFQNSFLEHLFFVFPELILVVLAGCILLGRYTGYRAAELFRFRTA
ncbi:inactive transglutaminase family protein [Desulfonatronovibrio hydrogenovorans]|uniref:inactive transglutaminase family protein n=1 Tax=Desulfonatronovibrio hydrogenovorans TaxID=53245 RepID=UPI0004918E09|nr:inactive transglutaminase family protein [Desulfonatronovibrio hydrogenovorans]